VHDFQFLFHDQSYLIRRNKTLKHEYDVLVKRIERQQLAQFMELKKSGSLIATDADAERLAKQVTFIAIMWQDFFDLVTQNETDKVTALQSALTQTLGLLLPYLRVDEQLVVEQYSKY
jgi:hypothetical protein